MKIRPVEAELFHVDGHTDRHDEANTRFFCDFANTSKTVDEDTTMQSPSEHVSGAVATDKSDGVAAAELGLGIRIVAVIWWCVHGQIGCVASLGRFSKVLIPRLQIINWRYIWSRHVVEVFTMESGWSTLFLGVFAVVLVRCVAGEWNCVFR